MAPMLARPPFHRSGWLYEEKVDSWRMLACKDSAPRLPDLPQSRRSHAPLRELAAAVGKLCPETVVLDGEVRRSKNIEVDKG